MGSQRNRKLFLLFINVLMTICEKSRQEPQIKILQEGAKINKDGSVQCEVCTINVDK